MAFKFNEVSDFLRDAAAGRRAGKQPNKNPHLYYLVKKDTKRHVVFDSNSISLNYLFLNLTDTLLGLLKAQGSFAELPDTDDSRVIRKAMALNIQQVEDEIKKARVTLEYAKYFLSFNNNVSELLDSLLDATGITKKATPVDISKQPSGYLEFMGNNQINQYFSMWQVNNEGLILFFQGGIRSLNGDRVFFNPDEISFIEEREIDLTKLITSSENLIAAQVEMLKEVRKI